MEPICINNRLIGPDEPPFIIAEVGINHEGDFKKAMLMVDEAFRAGADCIKFQCHITESEMIPTDMKPGAISDEPLWDIMKRCELSEEEERSLKQYAEEKGIIYLCTPFSSNAVGRLESLGVAAYKIGSGECNNIPLIKYIARLGKPIILSTGMNDLDSVRRSVDIIKKYKCPLMLMHCTSIYPTPYNKVRLGAIQEMISLFNLPVGLSDHSIGIYTSLGAIALGACAIEKHFTVSRKWPGCDVPISIEPDELAQLVKGSRAIFEARGGKKIVLSEEQPVIDFAFASVVSIAPIKAGDTFSAKNIWVKRPGTGAILAEDFEKLIGKRAAKDIEPERQINPEDIVDW